VVLVVGLEVLGEVGDALGQKRYLDLGAAGVGIMLSEVFDDFDGFLAGDGH
jgi:hypothetical protein